MPEFNPKLVKYFQLIDELRTSREEGRPTSSQASLRDDLENAFEELDYRERRIAEQHWWRGWPDEFAARTTIEQRDSTMTWNHRVVRKVFQHSGEVEETTFSIHEAYYSEKADHPHSITKDPIAPMGESVSELKLELERMLEACSKPVLAYEEFDKE